MDDWENMQIEIFEDEPNRKLLLNGNGFILGVSGSGKSFAAKMEILMSALFSNVILSL